MASLVAGDEGDKHEWGKRGEEDDEEDDGLEKEKPDFGLSGALAKDAKTGNTVNGVVLKFNEPPEARMPDKRWRLYVYKEGKEIGAQPRPHPLCPWPARTASPRTTHI